MTAADLEGLTTHEMVHDAVDVLNDGDVVLGGGEIDYAAANMLDVLAEMHEATGINLELLPQVREFARLVVQGWPPVVNGHLVVEAIGGTATVTVHRQVGMFCLPLVSVLLDPAQVLDAATKLTRASVPPPPVLERRIQVQQDRGTGVWAIDCPECLPLGSWMDQPTALAKALEHLRTEHASEVSA